MATDRETQLLQAAYQTGITSPRELANFMAQVNAESGGLNKLDESFRYTTGISQIPVRYAHREGDKALETARLGALHGHPEELARLMYSGRNGNNDTTDGYTYRGRGYIQLTGKDNYKVTGDALHLDLVSDPGLAAKPENAAKIAVWYWRNRVSDMARQDVKAATLAINGGYNGLDTRQTQFTKWEKILTPETMQHLANGQAPSLAAESTTRHAETRVASEQNIHGDNVSKLQSELTSLGYKDSKGHPLKVDGNFGPDTRHAVERFQHDHHLKVDGIAGPMTLKALDQAQTRNTNPGLDNPTHADHALFLQAQRGVHQMDAERGRTPDQYSDNLAAALTVQARHNDLTCIDQVALSPDGERAFAVQHSVLTRHAQVPTGEAVQTSIEQSSAAWQQVMQQRQATQSVVEPVTQHSLPAQGTGR